MLHLTKKLYYSSLDKQAKYVYLKNSLNSIFLKKHVDNSSTFSLSVSKPSSLLFLNNGLTQSQILKLRSLFLSYNLSFTNLPLRSFLATSWKKSTNIKNNRYGSKNKIFSGQLFILYSRNHNFPLPFLHNFLLYFLAHSRKNKVSPKSYNNLGFTKHFNSLLTSNFSTEIENSLLPWESISSNPISSKSSDLLVNEWLKEDPFSLFFSSLSKSSLIFSGSLNYKSESSSFNNISIDLNNYNNLPLVNTFNPSIKQYQQFENHLFISCFFSIESYNLSYTPYNLSFLYHL